MTGVFGLNVSANEITGLKEIDQSLAWKQSTQTPHLVKTRKEVTTAIVVLKNEFGPVTVSFEKPF